MAKSLKEIKADAKVSKLTPVETPAPATVDATEKSVKRSFSEAEMEKYLTILSDGKPHKIQDLLKEFGLPSTTSGREKLRAANRLIEKSGSHSVQGIFPEGVEGKHFQLIENANGSKVVDAITPVVDETPAPVQEEVITQ